MTDHYWTHVNSAGDTSTYERRLPHGVLIRVSTRRGCDGHIAEAIAFVPNPSHTQGPHR